MEQKLQQISKFINELEQYLQKEQISILGQHQIQWGMQLILEDQDYNQLILNIYEKKGDIHWVPNKKASPIYTAILPYIQQYSNKIDIPFKTYIGTDESGKGDYFGPLVVAGFITDLQTNKELFAQGIHDSKKISDQQIINLAKKIKSTYPQRHYTFSIEPQKYNILYGQYKVQGKNLNHLLGFGHAHVIQTLLKRNDKIEGIVADQFGNPQCIYQAISNPNKQIPLMQNIKGESDMAIAAASILARAQFLTWLEETSLEVGFELPKGANWQTVDAAKRIIIEKGKAELKNYVKLHFKTTHEVICN